MLFDPIFQDTDSSIGQLISSAIASPWMAGADEVSIIQAGQAIAGENWAPQLTPYAEWKSEKPKEDNPEYNPRNTRAGEWGRPKCISDEERERLVAIGLENAHKLAEQRQREREEAKAHQEGSLVSRTFGVKQGSDGYVLAKVDLRAFAEEAGVDDGLVVVLPSSIDGVPVTRIDAEAFSRYNARGIGVRLLVVPDSVAVVDANAFSFLAAETVYIGSGCIQLGGQPLERRLLKPAIDRRDYVVSESNAKWASDKGSVFSKDGKRLLFFAPPYGKQVVIPESISRIDSDAIADWGDAPDVVKCGYALERMGSKLWDSALWLCPHDAPMFDVLLNRSVRLASPNAVMKNDCWFDFDEEYGVLLVAAPPAPLSASQTFVTALAGMKDGGMSASQAAMGANVHANEAAADSVLSLPREIDGVALTRVAPRSLVDARETLILPEGLESVGYDNACKKTKHLSLPHSLRKIEAHCFCSRKLDVVTSIPSGVKSIGEGCFEYCVCRLEHTGTVVHVSANQLLNCFIQRTDEEMALLGADPAEYVPFDYERYDELLREGRNLPDRLGALIHRIAVPFRLSDATKANIIGQLKAHEHEAMEYVAREGDIETVANLMDAGFIDSHNFDEQIEMLRRCNRTDCVLMMMDRHRAQNAGKQQQSVKSRFSL